MVSSCGGDIKHPFLTQPRHQKINYYKRVTGREREKENGRGGAEDTKSGKAVCRVFWGRVAEKWAVFGGESEVKRSFLQSSKNSLHRHGENNSRC